MMMYKENTVKFHAMNKTKYYSSCYDKIVADDRGG